MWRALARWLPLFLGIISSCGMTGAFGSPAMLMVRLAPRDADPAPSSPSGLVRRLPLLPGIAGAAFLHGECAAPLAFSERWRRSSRGPWDEARRQRVAGLCRTILLDLAKETEPGEILALLRKRKEVLWAEIDGPVRALGVVMPDDTSFPEQWALDNTGQSGGTPDIDVDGPEAWGQATGDPATVIALLDTGLAQFHPEFQGRVVLVPGADLVNGDDDPEDDAGHGTHVTGIAAATGNNGIGVAGLCWQCGIMPIKVLDARGIGTFSNVAAGITKAASNGARVINLSIGADSYSQAIQDAIDAAVALGTVVVAAAGNNGTSKPVYPAANDNVLAVAAIDRQGQRAIFSSYGDWVDLGAPGVEIWSTLPGGAYGQWQGTSLAAPVVTGIIALLASVHPTWNVHLLSQQVLRTAKTIPALDVGAGLPSAALALSTPVVPEVAIFGVVISDPGGDGDGRLDLGESVTLSLEIQSGFGNLSSLSGTLSSPTAGVSITDGTGSWGDIASGEVVGNGANSFALTLSPPAKGGGLIQLDLLLLGDGPFGESLQYDLEIDGGTELPSNVFCTDTTLAEDTYVVRNTLLVCQGATLTLPPGTIFRFLKKSSPLDFIVQGKLRAVGTLAKPILLTSAEKAPAVGDWGLLRFDDTSEDSWWWGPRQDLNVVAGPLVVVAGDIDGDSDADLVVSGQSSTSVTLLTSDAGSWTRQDILVGTSPQGVAVGDLDGDSDADIAVANKVSGTVTMLTANAQGVWSALAEVTVGSSPTDIVIGDLDSDLDPDVAVTNMDSGTVSLLLLDLGVWARTDLAVGTGPEGLAIGDIDGDNQLDIVVANSLSDTVTIWWRGTGQWTREDVAVGAQPVDVALADLDGDASLEIVCSNSGGSSLSILRYTGNTWLREDVSLSVSPYGVAVGDADQDGDLDIALANPNGNSLSLLLHQGTTWVAKELGVGNSPYSVALGDLDGDGDLDIAATDSTNSVVSLLERYGLGEGSALQYVHVEYSSGVSATGANPYLADVTIQHTAQGFAGDSASNPLLERMTLADTGSIAITTGPGSMLRDTTISGGYISVGLIDGGGFSDCGFVKASAIVGTTVERCGNVTGGLASATLRFNDTVSAAFIRDSIVEENSSGIAGPTEIRGSTIAHNGGGVTGVTGVIEDSFIFANAGTEVTGSPEIRNSTIADADGDGILLNGAGSASGSTIDLASGTGFSVRNDSTSPATFTGNYWGAAVTAQMEATDTNGDKTNDEGANIPALYDWYDAPQNGLGIIDYGAWLSDPASGGPVYLQQVTLDPPSPVSAETVTFTLLFSGSMDSAVLPSVTFGVDPPYDDFALANPQWSTTRLPNDTLALTFDVQVETPDGTYTLLVTGARSAAGRALPDHRSTTFVIDTPVGIVRGLALGTIGGLFREPHAASGRGTRSIVASWQPLLENDLGGYTLHWKISQDQLTDSLDTGLLTSMKVSGFTVGETYDFAVLARDDQGNPSQLSSFVSFTIPATGMVPLGGAVFALALLLGLFVVGCKVRRRRNTRRILGSGSASVIH